MKSRILGLFGFNPTVVNRMDGTTKRHMAGGALSVMLVASLSAILIGITFSRLCFNGDYFLPIALIWFLFIYTLDTLILNADWADKTVKYIRLFICAVLACFHSLTMDALFFHDDVSNYLTRQYNTEVQVLDSAFTSQNIAPLLAERVDLRDRNRELNRMMKKSRNRVYVEVDEGTNGREEGYGTYAKFKEKMHLRDSTLYADERADNTAEINNLSSRIDALQGELKDRKRQIVKPEQAGLRDNINAMQSLIWGPEGTFSDRLYFVLLLILGFIFESLVVIAKMVFGRSFKSYQEEVDRERTLTANQLERRHQMKDQLNEMEQSKSLNEQICTLQREMNLDGIRDRQTLSKEKAEMRFQRAKEEADLIFNEIKDAGEMDDEIKNELNGLYEAYGEPLVTKSRLDKIKKIAEDLKNREP